MKFSPLKIEPITSKSRTIDFLINSNLKVGSIYFIMYINKNICNSKIIYQHDFECSGLQRYHMTEAVVYTLITYSCHTYIHIYMWVCMDTVCIDPLYAVVGHCRHQVFVSNLNFIYLNYY